LTGKYYFTILHVPDIEIYTQTISEGMMTRLVLIGMGVVLVVASLAGCEDKLDPLTGLPDPGDIGSGAPSYVQDIKPVFDQNCVLCHDTNKSGALRNGAPVSVNFDTYQKIIDNLERASIRVQAGTMPPTGPLDSETVTLILEWIAAGSPEGDQ
jgi:uncharacterized membrane protein